jgi:peptide/nickel transport system substrate-binding protein
MKRTPALSRHLTALVAAFTVGGLALVPMAAAEASTSPSPGAVDAGAPADVTFTVGIAQDVDTLNVFKGIVAESYEMWGLMYDQLIGYSQEDFSPVPQLAESWEESADKTTWTYKIRSGVNWSDGVPLTANDVAYTFNRILNGKKEKTNYGSYVENITKVVATDDTTVVMTVSKPSPIMESLAVPILPEHIWENVSEEDALKWPNDPDVEGGAVGSGPFILTERKKNQYLRFTANTDYWAGSPKVKEIDFRIFTNQDSLAQALKRGEIDLASELDPGVFKSLQNVEGITTSNSIYSGWNYLVFNGGGALADGTPIGDGNPVMKDRAFRDALSYAVDSETLVKRVLNGYGEPGTTVIPPIYQTFHLDPPDVRTFDLEKAGQLLTDAGYPLSADGKRLDKNGNPITLRLLSRSESQSSQQSVKFIQGWFQDLGLTINVDTVGEDPLYEIAGQANFDMYEWGWVVEPDPNYQLSTFTCANRSYKDGGTIYGNLSDTFYCNPEYDKLFKEQSVETDREKRAAIVKQMQQMLYDDAVYVVTFYYDNLEAYRSDKFTNVQPQPVPDGSLIFQYGTFTYRNVEPVTAAGQGGGTGSGASSSDSTNWGLIGGIVLAVAALLIAALAIMRSRRDRAADDTE